MSAVYRPPQGNLDNFSDYFNHCLESIDDETKKYIFILGDFNIYVEKKSQIRMQKN